MTKRAPVYQEFNSITKSAIDRCYYHDYAVESHYHMNPELVYVSSGTLNVTINASTTPIEAGNFCLVLPWQVHAYDTPETSESVIIVFPSRYIQLFVQNMGAYCGVTQVFPASAHVAALFMEHLYDDGVQPDEYIFSSVLYGLCHCFMAHCALEDVGAQSESSLQMRMMNYISVHRHEDISLQRMAELFGYSYFYLSHLFRKNTGLSFHLFCNIKRVEEAASLLEEETISVSEIAWRCGFRNIRTFNRVFLQLMGQSPSRYRGERLAHNSSMTVYESDLRLATEYIGIKPDQVRAAAEKA